MVAELKKGGFLFMEKDLINEDYKDFIGEIKNKIRNSQYEAMKVVNRTLINLYWGIGQEIYNQQQEKGWGKSIVEVLSKELEKEFPDVKGFSARNLWRMRNLYVEYKDNEILPSLVAEISWSKNVAEVRENIYVPLLKNNLHISKVAKIYTNYTIKNKKELLTDMKSCIEDGVLNIILVPKNDYINIETRYTI